MLRTFPPQVFNTSCFQNCTCVRRTRHKEAVISRQLIDATPFLISPQHRAHLKGRRRYYVLWTTSTYHRCNFSCDDENCRHRGRCWSCVRIRDDSDRLATPKWKQVPFHHWQDSKLLYAPETKSLGFTINEPGGDLCQAGAKQWVGSVNVSEGNSLFYCEWHAWLQL